MENRLSDVYKDITLVNEKIARVYDPSLIVLDVAEEFLVNYPHKTYSCRLCGGKKKAITEQVDYRLQAALTAARLCHTCFVQVQMEQSTLGGVRTMMTHTEIIEKVVENIHNREVVRVTADELFDPKVVGQFPCRMAVQVIRTDEDLRPGEFQTWVRHEYLANTGVELKKELHFLPQDSSPLLNDRVARYGRRKNGQPMCYGLMSIEARGIEGKKAATLFVKGIVGDSLNNVPAFGFYDKKLDIRFRGIVWTAIDHIVIILVPMDSNIKCLQDLGIELLNSPKSPKRLRRATAPHLSMLGLTEVSAHTVSDGVIYTLHHEVMNKTFRVKVVDMKHLSKAQVRFVDGMNLAKMWVNIFGKEYSHVKVTAILSNGLGKGFCHYLSHLDYDLVLFGIKGELRVTDKRVYLGLMGILHEGQARMDIQSMGNMGCYEPHLAPAEGKAALDEAANLAFCEDDARLRDASAVFARLNDARRELAQVSGTLPKEDETWAAVMANKLGIGNKALPVLFRRFMAQAMDAAVDITNGRISMTRVMRRLNLCPNLLAFRANGMPDPAFDQLTRAHFYHVPQGYHVVCAPDQPEGPMLMWRNPNTTKWEAILVWNVHLKPLMAYRHKGLVFFGFEACELLIRMNGGDMDDTVLVTSEAEYIKKWNSLEYPQVEKISAE